MLMAAPAASYSSIPARAATVKTSKNTVFKKAHTETPTHSHTQPRGSHLSTGYIPRHLPKGRLLVARQSTSGT